MPPIEREPPPKDWAERDLWGSWWEAIREIGEQVKAGRELPPLFRPTREADGEYDVAATKAETPTHE